MKTFAEMLQGLPKKYSKNLGITVVNSTITCYLSPENKWLHEQDLDAYKNRERRALYKNIEIFSEKIKEGKGLEQLILIPGVEEELAKKRDIPQVYCILDALFASNIGLQDYNEVCLFLGKTLRNVITTTEVKQISSIIAEWENKQQYLNYISRLRDNLRQKLKYRV